MFINNYSLVAELEPELLAGEKLIWTGKPGKGLLFRSADWLIIPFSFIWFGGVLSFPNFNILDKNHFSIDFFMLPFLVVGFYMTVGRFIVDIVQRVNTTYGVTNDRILIRSGVFSKTTNSIHIKSLYDTSIKEANNKRGTIIFGPSEFGRIVFRSTWNTPDKQIPAFEMIDDVRTVYQLIESQVISRSK
ncbi:PH domain-containing protein [Mucilaginibacter terrae]|uniref:PH domain-containing protein n=1 Tax=Mucilaginibacter terrae TaxID=1955052 RepID=UPI0036345686